MKALWRLDPSVTFLNHGSFGACPIEVLAHQQELRDRLERQPVRFMARELEGMLDSAREALGAFVGADAEDLAFVSNATTGVNTVLRSLALSPGDELLVTSQAYNACRNALDVVAVERGASVVVAELPFPIASAEQAVEAIASRVTSRTRAALLDHVVSPTGLVLPLEAMLAPLASRDVRVLVDGAHAPGMIPLDLRQLERAGVAWYTGNCHKWICAPKGAAFLWVRRDLQGAVHPLVTSHGHNSRRTDRSRFRLEMDWGGTDDPTAFLSVPEAIRYMGTLVPGGWPEIMSRNRALALRAREIVASALGVKEPACPESMVGSMAAVILPRQAASSQGPAKNPFYTDALQEKLHDVHGIEVPIVPWPKRSVRVSAQLYNQEADYVKLARALVEEGAR